MRAVLRMKRQEFTEEQIKQVGTETLDKILLCSHLEIDVHVTFIQCKNCKVSWTTY